MDPVAVLGYLSLFVISLLGVAYEWWHRRKARLFLSADGAFSEEITPPPFDPEQLERLKDLVSSVGVLALENQAQSRHNTAGCWTHVFVIDVEGAIHDVVRTPDVRLATRAAHGLTQAWGVMLDDPAGVLWPPEEVGLLPANEPAPRRWLANTVVDVEGGGD